MIPNISNSLFMGNRGGGITPPNVGEWWDEQGGYYTGIVVVDGVRSAVVLAPRDGGSALNLQWKKTNNFTPATHNRYDSVSNTYYARSNGINNHPAFKFCIDYRGGGFDDWVLPAHDVVVLIYQVFKPTYHHNDILVNSFGEPNGTNPNVIPVGVPYTTMVPTRTTVPNFEEGGTEALHYPPSGSVMWSSTQSGTLATSAFAINMWPGQTGMGAGSALQTTKSMDMFTITRAVRIVPLG